MRIKFKNELSERILKFIVPFIFAGIGILIIYLLTDNSIFPKLFLLMLVYFIPPLGKESVIPIGIAGGKNITIPFTDTLTNIPKIDPFVMAISIAFIDIMVALFLVWNYDLIKYIPIIGKVVERVEKAGISSASRYKWIKPLEFIGIVLFVIVPFQGSGGFFGSVVGRLIGMKPWRVFIAIFIGSFISTFLIAYFFDTIYTIIQSNVLAGVLIIIILIIISIMVIVYRKNKKKED